MTCLNAMKNLSFIFSKYFTKLSEQWKGINVCVYRYVHAGHHWSKLSAFDILQIWSILSNDAKSGKIHTINLCFMYEVNKYYIKLSLHCAKANFVLNVWSLSPETAYLVYVSISESKILWNPKYFLS